MDSTGHLPTLGARADRALPTGLGAPLAAARLDRRVFLAGGAAAAATLLLPRHAAASQHFSDVRPRDAWGANLPPTGSLGEERPEDVRFLLLHHTASSNDYSAEDVPGLIQSFYHYHTGDKGWPDVAYNFLIDKFGGVWEARAGSLNGPVKGSATGGSQGFALLCCWIGDFASVRPTDAAVDAMAGLCAALAHRYGIDTSPGTKTSFVSRGSNKHAEGKDVTTETVAGHRDMSQTTCPGDTGYQVVRNEMPERITRAKRRLDDAGSGSGDSGGSDDSGGSGGSGDGGSGSDDSSDSSPPDDDSDASQTDEETEEPEPEVPERRDDVDAPDVESARAGDPPRASGAGQGDADRTSLLDPDPEGRIDDPVATASQGEGEDSILDSLGMRELAVLGIAAAATAGGAVVAKRGDSSAGDGSGDAGPV